MRFAQSLIQKMATESILKTPVFFASALLLFSSVQAENLDKHPGKELFQTRGCFGCHGFKAEKEALDTPNLAGQSKPYMANQIRFIAEGKRQGMPSAAGYSMTSGMQGAVHYIAVQDLEQILDYLSQLPITQPVPLPAPLTKAQQEQAKQLFEKIGCAGCHGAQGQTPTSPEYPVIAGQTNTYLRRQLRYFRDQERSTGQSQIMQKNAHELTDEQVNILADYVSQLSPQPKP